MRLTDATVERGARALDPEAFDDEQGAGGFPWAGETMRQLQRRRQERARAQALAVLEAALGQRQAPKLPGVE